MESNSQMIIYQTEDGKTKLEVRLENETVWLTQKMMAELFQTTKQNISLHIQNIYEEAELTPEATVKKYLTVQTEGTRKVERAIDFYNLDMILSVGYRIRSNVATRFRQWATARLKEYIELIQKIPRSRAINRAIIKKTWIDVIFLSEIIVFKSKHPMFSKHRMFQ